jgi:hypothetical protein
MLTPLNSNTPDAESFCTGFGAHNRLVAALSLNHEELIVREDVDGLPYSTDADRQKVIRISGLPPKGTKLDYAGAEERNGSLYHRYLVEW